MSNDARNHFVAQPDHSGVPVTTYFPVSRSRQEVLQEIESRPALRDQFKQWDSRYQTLFLEICTGARGLRVVYDGVFKEIFNPEITPERLEEILSLLLKRKVKIKETLPNDGVRLGEVPAIHQTICCASIKRCVESGEGILHTGIFKRFIQLYFLRNP